MEIHYSDVNIPSLWVVTVFWIASSILDKTREKSVNKTGLKTNWYKILLDICLEGETLVLNNDEITPSLTSYIIIFFFQH